MGYLIYSDDTSSHSEVGPLRAFLLLLSTVQGAGRLGARRLFSPSPDWYLTCWLHRHLVVLTSTLPSIIHPQPEHPWEHSDEVCGLSQWPLPLLLTLQPHPLLHGLADLGKESDLHTMCWNATAVDEIAHLEIFLWSPVSIMTDVIIRMQHFSLMVAPVALRGLSDWFFQGAVHWCLSQTKDFPL